MRGEVRSPLTCWTDLVNSLKKNLNFEIDIDNSDLQKKLYLDVAILFKDVCWKVVTALLIELILIINITFGFPLVAQQ